MRNEFERREGLVSQGRNNEGAMWREGAGIEDEQKRADKEYGASEGLSDRISDPRDQSNVGHDRDGQKDPKHDRDGQRHPMVTQERWQQGKE